jgi:addiction module HigA family antidote
MGGADVFTLEDVHAGRVSVSDMAGPGAAPLRPVHPGRILLHDFLEPLGLSANALALALRVPANRITGIVNGQRAITADTALRLAQYFGGTPDIWLRWQSRYDLELAQEAEGERIRREVLPRAQPAS